MYFSFHANNKNKLFVSFFLSTLLIINIVCLISNPVLAQSKRQVIKSLYIPLADHYAAIVAYELYNKKMKYADFQIKQMKSWDLLRAYFQSGEVDMAYVMSPLAMDMYNENPHFKWIGLMHRDGNALAINNLLNKDVMLPKKRKHRKPNSRVAGALTKVHIMTGKPTEVGMPHLLSTHTVVLYKYLKEYGLKLSLTSDNKSEVLAIAVPPAKSPAFIQAKSNRAVPAAFEQSLPWADIVESEGYGHVAWYSKDVMSWKHGHVECIALATKNAINNKYKAVKEVMAYIQYAGEAIELARKVGGEKLETIVKIIRKHIPAHTRKAIIASLSPKLRVINYENLDVDKAGLKQVMDLAVEGGILKKPVDIDAFSDTRFGHESFPIPYHTH